MKYSLKTRVVSNVCNDAKYVNSFSVFIARNGTKKYDALTFHLPLSVTNFTSLEVQLNLFFGIVKNEYSLFQKVW